MRLLLLSNSTNKGEDYLGYPKNDIISFLGKGEKKLLFFPFATVTMGYTEYEYLVADRLDKMGDYTTTSIHRFESYDEAIEQADAFVVGGGNTYMLLSSMQKFNLIPKIRQKVLNGVPYIGWSAGANLCCPTIRTTNDMPIVWPAHMEALNLIPFQINPHYVDKVPEGFAGETREMRLREFIEVNAGMHVVGLPEGSLLRIENNKIDYKGGQKVKIFCKGEEIKEMREGEYLQFLLK